MILWFVLLAKSIVVWSFNFSIPCCVKMTRFLYFINVHDHDVNVRSNILRLIYTSEFFNPFLGILLKFFCLKSRNTIHLKNRIQLLKIIPQVLDGLNVV